MKNRVTVLLLILSILLISGVCFSQITTVQDGNWRDTSTWTGGALPGPGDNVLLEFDDNYGIYITNTSYIRITGFTIKGVGDLIDQAEADAAWGLYKTSDLVVHDLADELGIDINDPDLIGTDIHGYVVNAPGDTTHYLQLPDGYSKPNYYNGRAIVANKSHHIDITNNIIRDVPSAAIRAQQSDYVNIIGNEVYTNTYWTTLGVGAITVSEATVHDGNTETGVKIVLEKNYYFLSDYTCFFLY